MYLKTVILLIWLVAFFSFSSFSTENNPAPLPNYIAGGVVGTFLGLGIGQGINGNYGTTGWKFTVFEGLLGVAPLTAGLVLMYTSLQEVFPNITPSQVLNFEWINMLKYPIRYNPHLPSDPQRLAIKGIVGVSLAALGTLLLVSFRIWDIVDLWTTPVASSEQLAQSNKMALLPYWDGETGGLLLRF